MTTFETAITFSLDPVRVVQFCIAIVMPLLVGLVTKKVTSSSIKTGLLALFTLVSGMLAGLLDALVGGKNFDVGESLFLLLPQFVVSVAIHYGVWKPTGAAEKAQEALSGGSPARAEQ